MKKYDVIIIGAGAAGLMCAIEAGIRGRQVLVLEHANKPGRKILMSGGGRCNFTNLNVTANNFISHNPHFAKSALSRFTPADFIARVNAHHIPFHEKTLGQLFCDNKASDIVNMLLTECEQHHVAIRLNTNVSQIEKIEDHSFKLSLQNHPPLITESLVIATGGLSIPSMGSNPFGYQIAKQFEIPVWPTRAGLVPFTLHTADKEKFQALSGIAIECEVTCQKTTFKEALLFTHRGLSGPAMLQISNYWQAGMPLLIKLLPEISLFDLLVTTQKNHPNMQVKNYLQQLLPKRVVAIMLDEARLTKTLDTCSEVVLKSIANTFQQWTITPNNTEGYRTAEVTLGGVDCNSISSQTFAATKIPGLYFIGEVLDVTGWLGGYNFQWAWASGYAAGCFV